MKTGAGTQRGRAGAAKPECYNLRLFVAGDEPNSAQARASLEELCANYLAGNCRIEVVDVLQDFEPALQENILVTPALVIQHAGRRNVIFGNLADMNRVLAVLQIGSGQ